MSLPLRRTLIVSLLPLAGWTSAHAQGEDAPPRWEVGAFAMGVSQQAYPGSDEQLGRSLALPYLLYRGRWLRADGDTVGVRAARTQAWELDVGAAASFGGGGDEIEARRGIQRLGTFVEFGPRLKWKLGEAQDGGSGWRLQLPARAVFDLSDKLRHRGWALEPELVHTWRSSGGWRGTLGLGAIVADRALAETFYGVGAADATAARPRYKARSGLVAWRLSASLNKNLSRDWRIFGFVRADTVSGAANRASPLVRQTAGATLGIGVGTTLARSSQVGED